MANDRLIRARRERVRALLAEGAEEKAIALAVGVSMRTVGRDVEAVLGAQGRPDRDSEATPEPETNGRRREPPPSVKERREALAIEVRQAYPHLRDTDRLLVRQVVEALLLQEAGHRHLEEVQVEGRPSDVRNALTFQAQVGESVVKGLERLAPSPAKRAPERKEEERPTGLGSLLATRPGA